MIEQKVHIKGIHFARVFHFSIVHAVDDQLVQFGNDELEEIDHYQRCKSKQQYGKIFDIISVDMLAENQEQDLQTVCIYMYC